MFNLNSALAQEEIFWKQRSRVSWSLDSPSNTVGGRPIHSHYWHLHTHPPFPPQGQETGRVATIHHGTSKACTIGAGTSLTLSPTKLRVRENQNQVRITAGMPKKRRE
ncbi:hypothetical protein AMTR_s00132p00054370 [Amborella trichopoda]|uniref:Uncharacterized protein n=1 Tax=Amborella trichopoda TaxID=13333 RepID=W1NE66_AMBTC|nr:hypothetical protein AMTR_s00132p00054370 [Amborella trichopoda]